MRKKFHQSRGKTQATHGSPRSRGGFGGGRRGAKGVRPRSASSNFNARSGFKPSRGKSEREKIYIYGKHALVEALTHSPHVVRRVLLSPETAANEPELGELLRKNDIVAGLLKGGDGSRIVGEDAVHQGVIAVIDPSALLINFEDFVKTLQPNGQTMLVLLDELTDPHNVGAIIRSAAAFGASGVLMPTHNQALVTGAVVKASAGMVFRVPLVRLGNVNYTIDVLQKLAFRSYALEMNGTTEIATEEFDAPSLVVVGNEGDGIRQKTMERCDVKLRIPMDPRCESLNASVSAAVVLYAWSVKHPDVLGAGTATGAASAE